MSNPDRRVSVGYDVVEQQEVFVTGTDFIKRADEICPGTRVFIAQTALNADTVKVEEDNVSIVTPRKAVAFQCEYFKAANPGM
jgi:hypothetical protein